MGRLGFGSLGWVVFLVLGLGWVFFLFLGFPFFSFPFFFFKQTQTTLKLFEYKF